MSGQKFYRPDIDGLRALAVVPVLLYHVGFPVVTGGFIGVDIFFVISGYLITSIIFKEIRFGKFSFLSFYDRRFRRILPALFSVIIFVVVSGYGILLPSEYYKVGQSELFASISAANFLFFSSINYFEGETNPLLHLWSLAVEEQFYLIFPVVLVLGFKYLGDRVQYLVILICIISFIMAAVTVYGDSQAAFYLPQFRFWELLIGSVLATSGVLPPSGRLTRNLVALSGLLLVIGSILMIDRTTPFPGLSALPACAGTAMLIMSASEKSGTIVSAMLAFAPFRFVGLISYSLYLWHWPIIVLMRQGGAFLPMTIPPDSRGRILLLIMSFVAAILSWYFIERPFRNGKRFQRLNVVVIGVAASLLFCLVGAVIMVSGGFPKRFSQQVQNLAAFTEYDPAHSFRSGTCFIDSKYTSARFNVQACLPMSGHGLRILLLGDSHAAHLLPGLQQQFPEAIIGQVTVSGCRPLTHQPLSVPKRCRDITQLGFTDGIERFRPDLVIMGGNWQPRDLPALEVTLHELRSRNVNGLLVGPVPAYDAAVPKLLAVALMRDRAGDVKGHLLSGLRELDHRLSEIASRAGFQYASPLEALCSHSTLDCIVFADDNTPLQFDGSHLTASGSKTLFKKLKVVVRPNVQQP